MSGLQKWISPGLLLVVGIKAGMISMGQHERLKQACLRIASSFEPAEPEGAVKKEVYALHFPTNLVHEACIPGMHAKQL